MTDHTNKSLLDASLETRNDLLVCPLNKYLHSTICVPYDVKCISQIHWNLFIKDTLNKGHLSTEDSVCSSNRIELCTNLPLNLQHLSIQDSQLGLNGVHYREVPLYTGQPAGSQWCPL